MPRASGAVSLGRQRTFSTVRPLEFCCAGCCASAETAKNSIARQDAKIARQDELLKSWRRMRPPFGRPIVSKRGGRGEGVDLTVTGAGEGRVVESAPNCSPKIAHARQVQTHASGNKCSVARPPPDSQIWG